MPKSVMEICMLRVTVTACSLLLAEIISRTANGSHANVQRENAQWLLREVEVVGVRFGCVPEREPLDSALAATEHIMAKLRSLIVR